jgi:cytochrome c
MKIRTVTGALAVAGFIVLSPSAFAAVDAAAAQATAKKEGCLKCHAIDKKKEANSLKDIAKKYAGDAGAQEKLEKHLLTGPKVKLEDGTEEEHKIIKTKDKGELSNLVAWILSLK